MAILNVNPTRMELTRLKKRLMVARRGHKLLKDKRDELMKKFLEMVRRNKELREKVESMMMNVHSSFLIARSVMSSEILEGALMLPKQTVSLDISSKNIMSVYVPVMKFNIEGWSKHKIYPYGFATTSAELDNAITALYRVTPYLLELAQLEKSTQLLAEEIEKTRRRVNALEHVLIPQLTDTIKYITMKLDENERGNLTRLMKVKDMMIEQARGAVKYIIPLILITFFTTGCGFLFKDKEEGLLSPLEEPQEIKYTTMEVQTKKITQEISDSGAIRVSSEEVIFPKKEGRLKALHVDKGDIVQKGDKLVEFETDNLIVKCKKYEADLQRINVDLTQTTTQIEREIELGRLDLKTLKDNLLEKETIKETVFIEGGSSARALEEDIEAIKSKIIRQEITIEGLEEKLKTTKCSLDIEIKDIERGLEQAQKELEDAIITSPIEGIVFDVSKLNIGENVAPYQSILTIVKPENIYITYSGHNVKYFEVGMEVRLFFDDNELEGEVVMSPSYAPVDISDTEKNRILIKIKDLTVEDITKSVGSLRIKLVLDEREDAVVIPKRVLQNYLGNKYVYVLEDNIKKQRFVEIGIETNTETEIIKGLMEGEIVVEM